MFKIGEKVVYVGNGMKSKFDGFKCPKVHEIVTIHALCDIYEGYKISEYMEDNNGHPQTFRPNNFRKLDYEFAENLLSEIAKDFVKEDNLKLQSN